MTSTISISSSVKKLELSTGFPAHHALFPWSSLCLVPKTLREYGKVSSITQGIKGKDTSSLFPRYLTLIENSFPSTTCLNTMSGWRREKHPGVEFLCDFHVPLSPPPSILILSLTPPYVNAKHEIHHETQTREPVHSQPKSKVFS